MCDIAAPDRDPAIQTGGGIQAGLAKKGPQPTPEALLAGIANAG
jgi:hypothetical protein